MSLIREIQKETLHYLFYYYYMFLDSDNIILSFLSAPVFVSSTVRLERYQYEFMNMFILITNNIRKSFNPQILTTNGEFRFLCKLRLSQQYTIFKYL